jgi:4-amino-4-deoxy-L-arabinose transferase-like glycosyltransferase
LLPRRHFIFLILLAALGVRLLPAAVRFVVGTDEAAYLTLAQNLAADRGFTMDGARPHTEFDPGYPLAASLVYRLGGGLELPAQINLVVGGLIVLPVYWLARDLRGERAARRAAWMTALLPALVLGVPNFGASSEQLYGLYVWLGLLALWRGIASAAPGWFILAGLAFGWAHLTRWEGAVYLFVGAGWAGWFLVRKPDRERRLVGLLGFVLSFAILAAPYGVYLQHAQGTWFSSKGATQQIQGEAVATDDPLAWERAYDAYEQARDAPSDLGAWAADLWADRDAEIRLYLTNWLKQIALPFRSFSFLAWLWAPLVPVALWKRGPDPDSRRKLFFLLTTLAPLALFPVAFVDPRYLLPFIPAGLMWAADGLLMADDWLTAKRIRPFSPFKGIALAALLSIAFLAADVAGAFLVPAPLEYKALGEWMAEHNVGRGEIVMARRRQAPFYAGSRWEWLPLADTEGLLARAAERSARYVVIDERTVPSLRPDLAYLLDPEAAPAGLELVVEMKGEGKRILLYRLTDH